MPKNSFLDLQQFYPDELEIVSIEEDSDEIRLHMRSRSKSFCCHGCGEELHKLHATHHRTVQEIALCHAFCYHNHRCIKIAGLHPEKVLPATAYTHSVTCAYSQYYDNHFSQRLQSYFSILL